MVKWLVLGTLRHLLGLIVILTVAAMTYAATFIPAPAEARPILLAAGFVAGLVLSAVLFGVIYLLFDIADNTRETVELLRTQRRDGSVDLGFERSPSVRAARQPGQRIEPRL